MKYELPQTVDILFEIVYKKYIINMEKHYDRIYS